MMNLKFITSHFTLATRLCSAIAPKQQSANIPIAEGSGDSLRF